MARRPERIPIILELFKNNSKALLDFTRGLSKTNHWLEIERYWLDNPDQRFGQVLINMGLIPDSGVVFFREEVDFLINNGYLRYEDINFWGINYEKDGTRLPETEYRLLKHITDDHILGIKKFFGDQYSRLHPQTREYFDKRLEEIND